MRFAVIIEKEQDKNMSIRSGGSGMSHAEALFTLENWMEVQRKKFRKGLS